MNRIAFLSLLNIIVGVPPPPPMEQPPVPPLIFASILKNIPIGQPKPTKYRYATEWLNRAQSFGVERRTRERTPPPPCPAPPHFFATKWINIEKG